MGPDTKRDGGRGGTDVGGRRKERGDKNEMKRQGDDDERGGGGCRVGLNVNRTFLSCEMQ